MTVTHSGRQLGVASSSVNHHINRTDLAWGDTNSLFAEESLA